MARRGKARRGMARHGRRDEARLDPEVRGWARQACYGKAWQGWSGHGKAGKVRHG